ncbi:unnamed protein product [Paramecium pentaurelia]|uniref:Uncharacterized protein n=1 Tax=Paramecium pentaurelia TaxID=43138 RepID=A0A8S1UGS1_9CILI|nr:unnamed protein product [Paramecium pentaurelia]
MFKKVKNYFKSLRMSSQIILINFCIVTFTVLVILATYQVQSAIFFTFIKTFSQTLSQKQEKHLVQIISEQLRQYIQHKNSQTLSNLQHSNDFFQYVTQSRNRYKVIQSQFQECIEQNQINEYKVIYNSDIICQGFEIVKSNNQEQDFNDTLTLLSPFSQLFIANEDSKISYFDIPKTQYFGSFPNAFKFKNYNLYTRPWYINHMTQSKIHPNSSYFYSPILLSARNNLPYSALTYSLVRNNSMIGIALQILPISDTNIQNIPLNILLVHQNGDVILSTMDTFHQITDLVRITNTTYTGFNETDWQTIQDNSKDNQNENSTFYLMNKIYQRSVFVYTYQFIKENLTMIVFKNVTYEQEIADEITILIDNLESELIQQIQIQIACCSFLLMVTASLIRCISQPLLKLIKVINEHVIKMGNNLNSEIFKMAFKTQTKKNADLFSSLAYQFMALKDLQTKSSKRKSNLCQEMESIQYNFKFQETDSSKIQELIQQIPQNETKSQNLQFFQFDSQKLLTLKKMNKKSFRSFQTEEIALNEDIVKNESISKRLYLIKHQLQKIYKQNKPN